MRVYLPATVPLLAAWISDGHAPAGPGYAVTPALREWYADADLEEMEYAATIAAGLGSLNLLAGDPAAPRRRVVLAVDVPEADVTTEADAGHATGSHARAAVGVGTRVPMSAWASALVDAENAVPVVADAVDSLPAAAAGDDDAGFAIDEAVATELGWYAVQELPFLLELG